LRRRRFAEVIGGQRLKRRQRRVGIRPAGQQAQLIVAAHLQQGDLVEAVRFDAFPVFLQHQIGVKARQRGDQLRRRTHVQAVVVVNNH
jgi:hypothetical protein